MVPNISFSDLPGFPNLFLDYIDEFENVAKYFPINFRDDARFIEQFQSVLFRDHCDRSLLIDCISDDYEHSQLSAATQKNLELLSARSTLAVVTGQQLGILGGPLYTVYKILTVLKLIEKFKHQFPAYNFVPIFWLESDDHDIEEISRITVLDDENNVKDLLYGTVTDEEDTVKESVGEIKLTAAIEPFLESYANSLRATEFTSALLERLRTWYREGATFKGAFRKVLFELFDKFGLIIFDPQNERIKSQLIPVFRKSLTDHASISPLLVERSAELEESYHAQVKIKPINVFYQSEKGRILIEPDESAGFRLKRKRVKFSEEEILSLLNMYPERFSPNVLLRPICQDFIFPTAVYVAGPSEISYFAQVMPLYSVHDIQPPIIYPRASATLLEPQQNNLIEKYQINLQELFLESEIFQQKAVQKAMGVDIDLLFSNSEGKLSEIFDELTSRISRIDKTTADGGERYRVKMIAALGEYKQKTLSAEKRKHEILFRQFEKLRSSLFPENTLQERKFNHWMYENKYGLSLIDTLYEKLEIELFQHQFISIAQ